MRASQSRIPHASHTHTHGAHVVHRMRNAHVHAPPIVSHTTCSGTHAHAHAQAREELELSSCHNLGLTLHACGEHLDVATGCISRASAGFDQRLGPEHPNSLKVATSFPPHPRLQIVLDGPICPHHSAYTTWACSRRRQGGSTRQQACMKLHWLRGGRTWGSITPTRSKHCATSASHVCDHRLSS